MGCYDWFVGCTTHKMTHNYERENLALAISIWLSSMKLTAGYFQQQIQEKDPKQKIGGLMLRQLRSSLWEWKSEI